MARYGLLTGQNGVRLQDALNDRNGIPSPIRLNADRRSPPDRNARNPFNSNIPTPPNSNSNSNSSLDRNVRRATANLSISAEIDAEKMADLGHFLSGNGPQKGSSLGSGGSSGGSSGEQSACSRHCCEAHHDVHQMSSWRTIWDRPGKYLLRLLLFIGAPAFAILATFAIFPDLLGDSGTQRQGKAQLERIPLPLPTISPPISIASATIAEETRKLPDFWPTIYEENQIFKKHSQQTAKSEFPSRDALITLYDQQSLHSQSILEEFTSLYNEYHKFIYVITTDLTKQLESIHHDFENPDDLLEEVEIGRWIKTKSKEPLYARRMVSQYEDYWYEKQEQQEELDTRVYNYHLLFSKSHCTDLNETLNTILSTLTTPTDVYPSNKHTLTQTRTQLLKMRDEIQKPCRSERFLEKLMKEYQTEVTGRIERCALDSRNVLRYVMPWRNYWGRTKEYKKRLYSLRILEMLKLQVESAVTLLGEFGVKEE